MSHTYIYQTVYCLVSMCMRACVIQFVCARACTFVCASAYTFVFDLHCACVQVCVRLCKCACVPVATSSSSLCCNSCCNNSISSSRVRISSLSREAVCVPFSLSLWGLGLEFSLHSSGFRLYDSSTGCLAQGCLCRV